MKGREGPAEAQESGGGVEGDKILEEDIGCIDDERGTLHSPYGAGANGNPMHSKRGPLTKLGNG